jgi:exportin-2 (importin alpha re-exporter)
LAKQQHLTSVEVYHLISKITKRFKTESKTNNLIREIIDTIKHVAPVMQNDAMTALNFLFSPDSNNKQSTILLYLRMLRHILNIFYGMNYQDFPEYFEDNLKEWIQILKGVLDLPNLAGTDFNTMSIFIRLKSAGMRCVNLYCVNYYEDIQQYHNEFLPSVWNLLGFSKEENGKLVKELLDYYKTIFYYKRSEGFTPDAIKYLIQILIIPNMSMTGKEIEEFEDNPTNFLKVELEETDMDSSKF